jgi:hypothetical protein
MLNDNLWKVAEHADWRLMTVAYKGLALGVLLAAGVPIWNSIRFWKQIRTLQTQLRQTENQINILQIHESRLRMVLSANSKVEVASGRRTEP